MSKCLTSHLHSERLAPAAASADAAQGRTFVVGRAVVVANAALAVEVAAGVQPHCDAIASATKGQPADGTQGWPAVIHPGQLGRLCGEQRALGLHQLWAGDDMLNETLTTKQNRSIR